MYHIEKILQYQKEYRAINSPKIRKLGNKPLSSKPSQFKLPDELLNAPAYEKMKYYNEWLLLKSPNQLQSPEPLTPEQESRITKWILANSKH